MEELTAFTPDRCAALVTPQIERLTFAVVHASIQRAGPRVMTFGAPVEALDIVGQLRTGLAARPVSAAGLAAVYRYRDAEELGRNLEALTSAGDHRGGRRRRDPGHRLRPCSARGDV